MLQERRRRGWGGFYQPPARSSVDPAPEGRGEEGRAGTMDQRKTCREVLEERQMRRYWRAQRRARKGGRRLEDNEEMGTKEGMEVMQMIIPKKAEAVKKKNIIQTCQPKEIQYRNKSQDQNMKRDNHEEGYNQAIFWKEPIPEIDCKDIENLSDESKDMSEEEEEENGKRELDIKTDYNSMSSAETEEDEEEAGEETKSLLLMNTETAARVGSGVRNLQGQTRKVVKEVASVEARVRRLQERLSRLEA